MAFLHNHGTNAAHMRILRCTCTSRFDHQLQRLVFEKVPCSMGMSGSGKSLSFNAHFAWREHGRSSSTSHRATVSTKPHQFIFAPRERLEKPIVFMMRYRMCDDFRSRKHRTPRCHGRVHLGAPKNIALRADHGSAGNSARHPLVGLLAETLTSVLR